MVAEGHVPRPEEKGLVLGANDPLLQATPERDQQTGTGIVSNGLFFEQFGLTID